MAKNSPQEKENRLYFSTKLNELLYSHNKKQVDLHRDLNIPKSTITGYVKGTSLPTGGNLQKIADYFNVLKSDLDLRFVKDLHSNTPTTLTSDVQAIVDVSVQLETPRQHNVLTYAKTQLDEQNSVIKEDEALYISDYRQKVAVTEAVAAGRGFAYGDNEINYCYTDRSDLPRFDIASYITGDSMEPEYHDGDVVLIRKEMYSSPGVYVVDYDGKSYLKKVYQEKDRFRLVSFNEKYDDIMIDLPIADDVYLNIVGRVVGSFTPAEK